MFGHPGFSALEFAGSETTTSRKTLSLKGKSSIVSSTCKESAPRLNVGLDAAEVRSLQPTLHEIGTQPRPRGTFINHTPRNFGLRSPKEIDHINTTNDASTRPHTSSYASSGGSKATSWSQPWRQTPPKMWDVLDINVGGPHELDSKEVGTITTGITDSNPRTSLQGSLTTSLSAILPRSTSLRSSTNSHAGGTASLVETQIQGKRRRRQTPYRIPTPKSSIKSRHSPLEPWIAHHRRQASQATGSSVGNMPPQVDIEDIAEVSTFRAIQEYFDSQASVTQLPETAGKHRPLSPENIPLPSSPDQPLSCSSAEHSPVLSSKKLASMRVTPGVPNRNPKRLTLTSNSRARQGSASSSLNSDFDSAAQGQYSPYDKEDDETLVVIKQRDKNLTAANGALRVGIPRSGRMAPPILGHRPRTSIDELSFYLKNTGPSPEPTRQQRKKSGFKIFKVGSKKTLAARVGSVEGSPRTNRSSRPPLPACARETITSSGTKHLRILVPTSDFMQDQTITLPISSSMPILPGPIRRSRHVSITFTDEMLNPLASPAMEHAILNFNTLDKNDDNSNSNNDDEYPSTTRKGRQPPLRSPKSSPRTPKLTAVNAHDHPLATRSEQTRARKLRDLKKVKHHRSRSTTEDTTVAAAPSTHRRSIAVSVADSDGEMEGGGVPYDIVVLKNRVISLQRQNSELAEALARIVGFETEDGDLDADAVLRACRQCRTSSIRSVSGGPGGSARQGRVFTA